MGHSAKYQVISSGQIKSGYERDLVESAFARIYKITPAKSAAYLAKKRVIKKDVPLEVAKKYHRKLESIGLDVSLVTTDSTLAANAPINQPAAMSLSLVEEPSKTEISEETVITSKALSACPKCGLEQEQSDECAGCGIIISKYRDRQNSKKRYNNAATPKPAITHFQDHSEPGLNIYILPLIAAILGAFLWKVLAVSVGFEFGVVAWGIGGAIGFAAAISGGRGEQTGMVCAMLVVCSIFGGKMLAASAWQDDFLGDANQIDQAIEEVLQDEAFTDYYRESKEFVDYVYDESSLRQFMLNNNYTSASTPQAITYVEIRDFKAEIQPELEEFYDYFNDGQPELQDTMTSILKESSLMEWVFASFGILDLLFLFLGASTAFQLGKGSRSFF